MIKLIYSYFEFDFRPEIEKICRTTIMSDNLDSLQNFTEASEMQYLIPDNELTYVETRSVYWSQYSVPWYSQG